MRRLIQKWTDDDSRTAPGGPVAISGGGQPASLLEIVWRRRLTVLLTGTLCVMGAIAYLATAQPIYTSTSRISVQQIGPKLLNDGQEGSITRSDTYIANQAEILRSFPVLLPVVNNAAPASSAIPKDVEHKLAALKKALVVEVGKKDDILSVSIDSNDPREAAALVNGIVKSYINFEVAQKRESTSNVFKVLAVEKEKRAVELASQQNVLQAFKQSNGDVFFQTEKGNIVMQDLAAVSAELAKARLDSAMAEAASESNNNRIYTTSSLAVHRERVRHFEKVYAAQQAKALALSEKTAQYDGLQRDISRTEKLIEQLDSRMKEVNVAQGAGPLNISIMEEGRVADKPSSPRRGVTLAVALMLGLVLGTGAALVRDRMDQRLQSAVEVSDLLGLAVLGVVPTINSPPGAAKQRQVELEPMSDVAEAYRSLRTAIRFALPGGESAKTILITSPSAGDGKSTSAANLAIAMAQANRRTLLIEADLRRPTQCKWFGASGSLGLSDLIERGALLSAVIQPTQVPGLDLIACGSIPQNPSEILNGKTFAQFLERMAAEYDQVIIDSPPVLPVSDARILGALCDATVLVLRARCSTRMGAAHACERLLSVRANVIGAIINDVPRGKSGYGQFGGYEHYYQHGSRPVRQLGMSRIVNGQPHGSALQVAGASQWERDV